ncbi:synapsin-1-like [Chroicocephalus ridibundus]|uniref:synapsin-1-like n=1 Tax=Chroicocephalus ridibundus TaxID=1192867 RepID=UPI002FDD5641
MRGQFEGKPEPLLFRIPQAFFQALQQQMSGGSAKKMLPNSTRGETPTRSAPGKSLRPQVQEEEPSSTSKKLPPSLPLLSSGFSPRCSPEENSTAAGVRPREPSPGEKQPAKGRARSSAVAPPSPGPWPQSGARGKVGEEKEGRGQWHITNVLQLPLEMPRDGSCELFRCPEVEVESIVETCGPLEQLKPTQRKVKGGPSWDPPPARTSRGQESPPGSFFPPEWEQQQPPPRSLERDPCGSCRPQQGGGPRTFPPEGFFF